VTLALTIAEWSVLATAAVGIAATVSPALVAWANRSHERKLARAERLYAQRHGAYLELTRFLERQRLVLDRTEPIIGPLPAPPADLDDDAWVDMRARWKTLASKDVQEALATAGQRFSGFVGAVMTLRVVQAQAPIRDQQLPAAREQMQEARDRATAAFDDAERVMNDELSRL
jgi:hypothetical protein